jgi:hypothetical protein
VIHSRVCLLSIHFINSSVDQGGLNFEQQKDLGPVATYKAGDKITVKAKIVNNHGGRMSVRLCPEKQGNQACFDKNILRRADNNKQYWYITKGGENQDLSMDYKLPAGVSCPGGCMLQWDWIGSQTCSLPCQGADDVDAECGPKGSRFKMGGADWPCKPDQSPEWFINCADIKIG